MKVLSTGYQVVGILVMIAAFTTPILVGIYLARDSAMWNRIVPQMIAAICAWIGGMGLGSYFVYIGYALSKRTRYTLCRVSAIVLLVLSVLAFPPLAALAIYALIVLNKDPVTEMFHPTNAWTAINQPALRTE